MKPLVIIPARGGSKGLPGKNIKILGGKPLIHWTIDEARKVFDDDVICVSTDDVNIKRIAEKTGLKVPFLRPKELATDTSTTQEVILHAINYHEDIGYYPDVVVLLQPTSPFRTYKNIEDSIELYNKSVDMVVSVKQTNSNPYFTLFEENDDGFLEKSKIGSYTRRQDCPLVYELNGALYVINTKSLKKNSIVKFTKIK